MKFSILALLLVPLTLTGAGRAAETDVGFPKVKHIIDTHIHLYDTTRPEGLPWPPKEDTVLYRPILTEQFNEVADANGVKATVIVEASEWIDDNQWVLDLVENEPNRYIGLVGSLVIGSPEFETHLKKFSADSRYVGIRMRERAGGEAYFNDAV